MRCAGRRYENRNLPNKISNFYLAQTGWGGQADHIATGLAKSSFPSDSAAQLQPALSPAHSEHATTTQHLVTKTTQRERATLEWMRSLPPPRSPRFPCSRRRPAALRRSPEARALHWGRKDGGTPHDLPGHTGERGRVQGSSAVRAWAGGGVRAGGAAVLIMRGARCAHTLTPVRVACAALDQAQLRPPLGRVPLPLWVPSCSLSLSLSLVASAPPSCQSGSAAPLQPVFLFCAAPSSAPTHFPPLRMCRVARRHRARPCLGLFPVPSLSTALHTPGPRPQHCSAVGVEEPPHTGADTLDKENLGAGSWRACLRVVQRVLRQMDGIQSTVCFRL